MRLGIGIGKIISHINIYLDLAGFSIRKKVFGFDHANAFIRRVGKNSIISLLKKNGAEIGINCDIEAPQIFHNCHNFNNLQIGDNVHIGKNCFFDLKDKIHIQDNVVVSMQVTFITHSDMSNSALSKIYPSTKKSILVKKDSYIGANATILMGVTIGDYALIGAGAVIVHEVQPWTLVGGVPAKIIKNLSRT